MRPALLAFSVLFVLKKKKPSFQAGIARSNGFTVLFAGIIISADNHRVFASLIGVFQREKTFLGVGASFQVLFVPFWQALTTPFFRETDFLVRA